MVREDTSQQPEEKRRYERKSTNVKVEIVAGGKLNKEVAKDISLSGIYVINEALEKYQVDESVVLAFESKTGEAHALDGQIVRKDEEGIGIRFEKELVSMEIKDAEEWN